ncbi:MAG: hypothetical protein C0392_04700 [Syntrophus sp. (in: bacteria)]|nr:hypothetical protein [Syntrophus sp. (in: bacteria)]
MKKRFYMFFVILSVLLWPVFASATITELNFLVPYANTGAVTYSNNAISGANIAIYEIIGFNTPLNPGIPWRIGGDLVTGTLNFTGTPAALLDSSASSRTYTAYDGTVNITSTAGAALVSGTMLQGGLTNIKVAVQGFSFNQGTIGASFISSILSSELKTFYGITDLMQGSISLSGSKDVTLTSFVPTSGSVSVVPSPPMVLLLATGLAGFIAVRIKFMN